MATKMQAACPKCGQQYSVADSMAGRTIRCSKCGATFTLSGPAPGQAARSTAGGGALRDTAGGTRPGGPGEGPRTVGPYEIRRQLGQGAFGVVYLAYHPFLGIEVAVKMLRAEALASQQSVERFLREAKLLARMDHPNVLRVYDAGKHGDDYYIASAYIAGKDLAQVIPEGGMDPARAVRLTVQMLRALGYAHQLGIVHRDVKPQNARLNDQDTLYLMDFGLAGLAVQEVTPEAGPDAMRLTRAGAIVGTPAYMAPEQAAGLTGQAGPAADLYSAGVVLFELLTGQLPFEGANLPALLYAAVNTPPPPPSELRPGLDARLDAICLRALAKQPEDRFRSAEEFAAALEGWLGGTAAGPVLAEPATVLPAPPPAAPRRRAAVETTEQRGRRKAPSTMSAIAVAGPAGPAAPPAPAGRQSSSLWLVLGGIAVLLLLLVLSGAVGYLMLASRHAGPAPTQHDFFDDRDKYKH